MKRAAIIATLLFAPTSAWALCPNCLGQNEALTPTLKLVGMFLLVPPIVAWVVARAIRRAGGNETPRRQHAKIGPEEADPDLI